jgi:hypothetical protein
MMVQCAGLRPRRALRTPAKIGAMTWSRRASSAAMVRAASGGVWNRRLDTVRFYERRGVGQHVNAGLRATGCSPSGSHRPSNQSSGERSARRGAGVGAPIPHRRWTGATACRKRSARDTGTPTRAWSLKPPRPATVADGLAVTRGSDPGHRRRQAGAGGTPRPRLRRPAVPRTAGGRSACG